MSLEIRIGVGLITIFFNTVLLIILFWSTNPSNPINITQITLVPNKRLLVWDKKSHLNLMLCMKN